MELVKPAMQHLASYVAALARGWSPDNIRLKAAAMDELASISRDPVAFLDAFDNPEAKGGPITMLDGTQAQRLPSIRRWMWDGSFCGTIGLRWQPGTAELPPHVLGHIGYAVVPWKRNRGYATAALRGTLDLARTLGLPHVILTTDEDNLPSQRVVLACGGTLLEGFMKPAGWGGKPSLRYVIRLD